ncbi:hypothetical protein [Pseudomonas citronellolis]|uniref:hypothetical protein n=1 Tax=Pseudomonas citronellolis TaxID=53408 RepID=UPI0008531A2D|nr:hypothetical protein [Pseudomonas humi]
MYDSAPRASGPAEEDFLFTFETHVLQKALPAFEEASRFARDRGLDCQVELLMDEDDHLQLCLFARLGSSQQPSFYRIVADTELQGLVHEQYATHGQRMRRLGAQLDSLDGEVLDEQLAEFFQLAFGMHLDEPRHRRVSGF